MNKRIFASCALALSLLALPSYSCHAYSYDLKEFYDKIENFKAGDKNGSGLLKYKWDMVLPECVDQKAIERKIAKTSSNTLIFDIINMDINNAIDYTQTSYEDDKISVNVVSLLTGFRSLKGNLPPNCIKLETTQLQKELYPQYTKGLKYAVTNGGIVLNITNKTNDVMEIDIGKSLIGLNGESVQLELYTPGEKNPVLLVPGERRTVILRVSFFTKRKHPFLLPDSEALGQFVLNINGANENFNLSARLNASKLR